MDMRRLSLTTLALGLVVAGCGSDSGGGSGNGASPASAGGAPGSAAAATDPAQAAAIAASSMAYRSDAEPEDDIVITGIRCGPASSSDPNRWQIMVDMAVPNKEGSGRYSARVRGVIEPADGPDFSISMSLPQRRDVASHSTGYDSFSAGSASVDENTGFNISLAGASGRVLMYGPVGSSGQHSGDFIFDLRCP